MLPRLFLNSCGGTARNRLLHFINRRFISRNAIYYSSNSDPSKSNSNVPAETGERPEASITVTKTIDAHIITPIPSKRADTLEYLRKLSSKNYFLRRMLRTPIEIMEWMELSEQRKVDTGIRFLFSFTLISLLLIVLHGLLILNFYQEHEITKREFLNTEEPAHIKRIDESVLSEIMTKYEGKFLPSSNSILQTLDKIMRKIISANKEIVNNENFDEEWTCIVLDEDKKFDLIMHDELKFLIITKATLQLCENEDQMAYVVANAMAHFILNHKREPFSNLKKYNVWTALKLWYYGRMAFLFTSVNLFTDNNPLKVMDKVDNTIGQFIFKHFRKLYDSLNYSDILEEEADRIALQLLARSCFDVREVEKISTSFRKLIADLDKEKIPEDEFNKCRYIYKHAFNEHKLSYLKDNLSKFIAFRETCGCPPLTNSTKPLVK